MVETDGLQVKIILLYIIISYYIRIMYNTILYTHVPV